MTTDELDDRAPPRGLINWTAFGFGVGYGLGRMLVTVGLRSLAKRLFTMLHMWARRIRDRVPSRASAFIRPGSLEDVPTWVWGVVFMVVTTTSFTLCMVMF